MKKGATQTIFTIILTFLSSIFFPANITTEIANISNLSTSSSQEIVETLATTTKVIIKVEQPKVEINDSTTTINTEIATKTPITQFYTTSINVDYSTPIEPIINNQDNQMTQTKAEECISNPQLNFSYSTTTNIFSGTYSDNCPIENDNLSFQIDVLNSKNYRVYSNNGNVHKETISNSSYFTFSNNGNEISFQGIVPLEIDRIDLDAKIAKITIGNSTQTININSNN